MSKVKTSAATRCYSYIRFSTAEQLKGHSLKRQTEKSEQFAKERGWILDRSLTMKDLGLSAFHGKHVEKGALGHFLALVKAHKIERGSVLLVESLDRLSRETVLVALKQFTDIISHGIRIVTIIDGMEYSEDSITQNWAQLIVSLTVMSRAYEESSLKSSRLSSAWRHKRQLIGEKILTSRCVAWLKVSKDRSGFELIQKRAEVVKSIYRMALKDGKAVIAKRLNQQGVECFGRGKGWHASYVHKILHNEAVIGKFQAHRRESGKRVKEGEVLEDYFPRLISDKLFYKVQDRLRSRRGKGGRRGGIRNLFTGLARCEMCQSTMQFVNKGGGTKGGTYLYCDSARRGRGCKSRLFRYSDFETACLIYCFDLDVNVILDDGNKKRESQEQSIRDKLSAVDGELLVIQEQINRCVDAVLKGVALESFRKALERDELRKHKLEQDRELYKKTLLSIKHSVEDAGAHVRNIVDLLRALSEVKGEQSVELRGQLRAELKEIIDSIEVRCVRSADDEERKKKLMEDLRKEISVLAKMKGKAEAQIQKLSRKRRLLKQLSTDERVEFSKLLRRSFVIHFKSGKSVSVILRRDDLSGVVLGADGDSKSQKIRYEMLSRKARELHRSELLDISA